MLSLSQFLEVEEGVEFKINGESDRYKIDDNVLYWYNTDYDSWETSGSELNDIIENGITILSRQKQILTDEEREYLKAVIYPVRDRVKFIHKFARALGNCECLAIDVIEPYNNQYEDTMYLYNFKTDTDFKGMELGKTYTLKDLGLEE